MKKYIIAVKKQILLFTLFSSAGTLALATIPLINKGLFDSVAGDADYSLFTLVAAYVFCILWHLASAYWENIWSWKMCIAFERKMKRDFFAAISRIPYTRFRQRDIGEYISIQSNDITTIESDYMMPLISLFNQIIVFIIYGIVLFLLVDWRVAIALLVASCAVMLLTNLTSDKLSNKSKIYLDMLGKYTAKITDFLQGKHLINRKTVHNIEKEHENIREETARARYAYGKYKSFVLPFNASFSFILTVIAFIVVGYLLYQKQITIGIGVAALGYIEAFLSPLQEIVYDVTTIISTKDIRIKVLDFLSTKNIDAFCISNFDESIKLDSISKQLDSFRLGDISCTFEKGKKYAIIGRNGCGKSTLLRIIMGHLDADNGNVYIDSKDLKTLDCSGAISYVSQHDHVFADTFLNNVTVFSSYPLKLDALASALGEDIYDKLKDHEDCQLLSGGEKQLVKISRMINEDKPICLLDEPFSDMDERTTGNIMEWLLHNSNKTYVVITHDLSEGLRLFDEILLMDAGKIVDRGTYDLISKTNSFKELRSSQNNIPL